MAEKLTRKEKFAQQLKSGSSVKQLEKIETGRRSLKRILGLFVAITGFILYANTFGHDYVLDDFGLIKDNIQTKQGISAIPAIFKSSYRFGMNITDYQLYRPLSKAMFAVEWQLAPDKPSLSHVLNVLFYALLCYTIFRVLCSYMKGNLLVPFLATLIFAAHPIHTEVVANIKSRDEIMCLLFVFASLGFLHRYISTNSSKFFIAGIACYFIALFSKESAITFLAVIPLMFYFFTDAARSKYYRTLTALVIFTGIFLLIRRNVLGGVSSLIPMEDNSLVAIKDFLQQRANAVYLMGNYLKLLVFPSPLVSDGSYNTFPPVALSSWKFLVPFFIFTGAAVYAIKNFKKKDPVSFGILYFFITASIVSNVIMLIGTNYGERLMFIPSLGFCIVAAVLISKVFKVFNTDKVVTDIKTFVSDFSKPILLVLFIVILFGVQTMARNMDWKDNISLYRNDIKKIPNSAHMLFYLANHITSEDYLLSLPDSLSRNKSRYEAIDLLTRAVTIFPKYADGYQRRGFIYNQFKDFKRAEEDYKRALENNPTHPIVYNNYGTLCFNQNRYEESMTYLKLAVKYNPRYAHALNNVASVYGVYGMGETELITKDPANREVHANSARDYFQNAISYFSRSIEADPEFAEPYRLMAVTYRNLGNVAEAERYERLYKEVFARTNGKN